MDSLKLHFIHTVWLLFVSVLVCMCVNMMLPAMHRNIYTHIYTHTYTHCLVERFCVLFSKLTFTKEGADTWRDDGEGEVRGTGKVV